MNIYDNPINLETDKTLFLIYPAIVVESVDVVVSFLTAYLVDVITDLLNKHKNDDSNDDFDLNTQACRVCRCQKQFIRNLRGL